MSVCLVFLTSQSNESSLFSVSRVNSVRNCVYFLGTYNQLKLCSYCQKTYVHAQLRFRTFLAGTDFRCFKNVNKILIFKNRIHTLH